MTAIARGLLPWRRCITPRRATWPTRKRPTAPTTGLLISRGFPQDAHAPFQHQWWFTDEFSDGPRRMMDAFWAVPEWAPADESHLLGSLSVVTKIAYGAGSVTYSTFDAESTDVLRLDLFPIPYTVGGKAISRRKDLEREGYTFDDRLMSLTIRHTSSRDVDIQGKSGAACRRLHYLRRSASSRGDAFGGAVSFRGDRLGRRAIGRSGLPTASSGRLRWRCRIPERSRAAFEFYTPHIFAGVDVYNDGDNDATVTVRSPETREISPSPSSPRNCAD